MLRTHPGARQGARSRLQSGRPRAGSTCADGPGTPAPAGSRLAPASSFDDAHARPGTSRFLRLPITAAQRRDHAFAAAQRSLHDGEPRKGPLPFADASVLLEQAEYSVRAFEAGEASLFDLPGIE